MSTDISKLTDRQLDALIAEKVMGLVECDEWYKTNLGSAGGPCVSLNMSLPQADGKRRCPNGHADGMCYAPDTGYPGSGPRKYSTDRNAAALVLEKIGSSGKWHQVKSQLNHLWWHSRPADWEYFIATATPRQLMEAAYLSWEGAPE